MPYRLFVYPLLFLMALQLAALCNHAPRSNSAQIIQRLFVFCTGSIAIFLSQHPVWAGIAWLEFVLFCILPALHERHAIRWLLAGEFSRAARAWRAGARFNWSRQQGRAYRRFAQALECDAVVPVFQELAGTVPELELWRLAWLIGQRDWAGAVACYETTGTWGSLPAAMQARLAAARAYAELGLPEHATRCLLFVALSPRTINAIAMQLWMTRVAVAALAGDQPELERLLADKSTHRRGFARFAATWRGRCAARRGDQIEAGRQLSRALALTPASLPRTRAVLTGYLTQSESCVPVSEQYRTELKLLQRADREMAPWRALMNYSRPYGATLILLAVVTGGFVVDVVWFQWVCRQPLWEWLGNVPLSDANGEWWRPVTALFLHANLLHWAANITGLWMFGMACERTLGWVRMLAIFLVTGVVANIASASMGGFDVSVGASGGIFGLVAAFGVAVYRLRAPVPAAIRRRLLWLMGAMVTGDFIIGAVEAQIDGVAHAGGFISGLVLAWCLSSKQSVPADARHLPPLA